MSKFIKKHDKKNKVEAESGNLKLKDIKKLNDIKLLEPKEKKKLIVIAVIFIILIFFVIVQNVGFSFGNGPLTGTQSIEQVKSNIFSLQKKLKADQINFEKINLRQKTLASKENDFWYPAKDGVMNIVIQNKIQGFATQSGVTLNTFGTIQTMNVSDGVNTAQFDIAGSGSMQAICSFINMINEMKPKMYWGMCSLRPENFNDPSQLYISANLTFLSVTDKELLKFLGVN